MKQKGKWRAGYETALKGTDSRRAKRRADREPEMLDAAGLKRRVERIAKGR